MMSLPSVTAVTLEEFDEKMRSTTRIRERGDACRALLRKEIGVCNVCDTYSKWLS